MLHSHVLGCFTRAYWDASLVRIGMPYSRVLGCLTAQCFIRSNKDALTNGNTII